ncbi:MAG: SET domain-containing protein-lysine N-methyltransferase [Myxococcota bacterium]
MTRHEPSRTALSYRSPKTEIRPSSIEGLGLFARVPIAAGEVVVVKGGYILTETEWRPLEARLGSAEIQIDEHLFIAPVDPQERDGSMIYSNHSCEPNIGIQGQIVFVAMRDIEAGEELTHDWATTDDLDETLDCCCGAKQCRGRVSGQDWRNPELQQRYRGWFAWHLQRKIDRSE